ncbi:MAG: phage tail protein [Formivibrio sp.]|nr:phage tail protein [Formivibrio sp.]
MIKINVQVDIDRAISKLAHVPSEVQDKALPRALNKTASQAKVQASREIRNAGYGLKVSEIKKAIAIRRANRSDLVASVYASGRPIALINYNARQTKAGVTVSVKNGRKLIRGAFIATMPSGHTGVYERVGSGHKKVMHNGAAQWRGLPIKELFGPSIPSAFMNETVQNALVTAIRERFPRLFAHEIAYLGLK